MSKSSSVRVTSRLPLGDYITLRRIAHAKAVEGTYPEAQVVVEAIQAFLRESIISGYVDALEAQASEQNPDFVPYQYKDTLASDDEGE